RTDWYRSPVASAAYRRAGCRGLSRGATREGLARQDHSNLKGGDRAVWGDAAAVLGESCCSRCGEGFVSGSGPAPSERSAGRVAFAPSGPRLTPFESSTLKQSSVAHIHASSTHD